MTRLPVVAVVADAATTPVIPTRGVLGISAQALLAVLNTQKVSGTLYLRLAVKDNSNSDRKTSDCSVLLSLGHGEPRVKAEFGADGGAAFDFAQPGATFSWWPLVTGNDADVHTDVPTLCGCYADSGVLWALPTWSEQLLLSTAETNLRGLAARLSADGFSGALVLDSHSVSSAQKTTLPTPRGLLLFQQGRLGGALYEAGAVQQRGAAALRTLTQLSAALTLHALPEPVVAGLLGWLLGLSLSDVSAGDTAARDSSAGLPEGFSGLELTPTGACFYRAGTAYLLQLRPSGTPTYPDSLGLFAACERAPSLALPGEPSGWEGRRYGLTLRGRDALNPMTELAMRFQGDFGRSGRRALEQFRREASVETAASALGLEVAELGELVERLEAEGFVRAVGNVSPTPHLQPR